MPSPPVREAPTIETERLILRAHGLSDFEDGLALWSDPDVVRFIGGRAASRDDTWSRLLRYAGHWSLLGYGFWAVAQKATGRYIGDVGVGEFQRAFDAPVPAFQAGAPEAGWALAVHAQGRGYATEAVRAALAWSDEHLSSEATLCIIHPDNAPSVAVARKCGFESVDMVSYRGEQTEVFRRSRPRAEHFEGE